MKKVFHTLRISNKLAAVFLLLLFMMGVGGAVGLYNAVQIANVTERLYLDTFKRTEILSSMERELLTQRQELFLHTIISEVSSKLFLERSIEGHKKKITSLLESYASLLPSGDKHLEDLRENLKLYWEQLEKVVSLSVEGKKEAALSLIRGEGDRSFVNALNSLKKLIVRERAEAYYEYQRSDLSARAITIATLIFTLLAIVTAAGLWLALTRSIVKPIVAIEESAKKIGKGDLSHRVPVMTEDEIGSLAVEFNRMVTSLENSYAVLEKKVQERTEELRRANEQLSAKKQELEAANKELVEVNRMKNQFLASVSHELRTPLNSIIGFSELLQEMAFGELNEKQLQYVEFIRSSGAHLLHLINNILEFSRLESGRMALKKEEFPITEVLGEVLGAVRPMAHERGIVIETKSVPGSPVIKADRIKFKQIMMNLISNAVKFNVDHGRVHVDWETVEEPRGMKMESYILIRVSDTGMGITKENMKRLFRVFEKVDPVDSTEREGSGLGLVLAKRLVELHGGDISVESEPGKGSVFTVKLPQGTERLDIPLLLEPSQEGVHPEKRPLVLIASESPDMSHLIEIYLDGSGFEVVTAKDGVELLGLARKKPPFAIIMGVTIPKKDGWEVLREIKSDHRTRHIPVVIISSTDNRQLALAFGAVDYLEKPVRREQLLDILHRLRARKTGHGPSSVLLLEDDAEDFDKAEHILERENIRIIKAKNNGEAIEAAIKKRPDVVVLCVKELRKKDIDLIEKLNGRGSGRKVPVIVFTEKGPSEEERSRMEGKVRSIICKGIFSKRDLLNEIMNIRVA